MRFPGSLGFLVTGYACLLLREGKERKIDGAGRRREGSKRGGPIFFAIFEDRLSHFGRAGEGAGGDRARDEARDKGRLE